jgi:hypothetical protein
VVLARNLGQVNTLNTQGAGIHQSDVILRSALITAINDMRANPWLLDYVFRVAAPGQADRDEYGLNEIERAKEWFQRTDIPVVWTITTNDPKFPCISLSLMSSQEVEQEGTLTRHPLPALRGQQLGLAHAGGPAHAARLHRGTGTMALDPTLDDIVLAPGMIVVTKAGKTSTRSSTSWTVATFKIKAGIVDDFNGMVIKSANPAYITELESAVFRETYALGCHVDSEPVHLTYLHSILVFILKRYNQACWRPAASSA